jgi:hypothetical protein
MERIGENNALKLLLILENKRKISYVPYDIYLHFILDISNNSKKEGSNP